MFWSWHDATGLHSGFLKDKRVQWGGRFCGMLFHRSVTTFVRFLSYLLETSWMPRVQCPKVRAWVATRSAAGLTDQQLVAGFVMAFLDDWFPFLCGTDDDIKLGHEIIMEAIDKMGFRISAPKLLVEGTPSQHGVILGHGIDLHRQVRFITPHKRLKISFHFKDFLTDKFWNRKLLEQGIGLL